LKLNGESGKRRKEQIFQSLREGRTVGREAQ
jgi:hypothetical protein